MFLAQNEVVLLPSLFSFIKEDILDEYTIKHHKDFPLENALYFILHTLFLRKKSQKMILSHSPNVYTDLPITYNSIQEAIQILLSKKIISKKYKGSIKLIPNTDIDVDYKYKYIPKEKGITSTYTLNSISEWQVYKSVEQRLKMYIEVSNEIVKEHNAEVRKKIGDKKVCIRKFNDPTLLSINKYLVNKGHPELQYTRIFYEEENRDLVHGRFYNSFQNIRKDIRKEVYEELELEELDMHAMAPNTLYMLETGLPFNGDVYNAILENLELPQELYRPLIKKCMLLVLGSSSREKAIKAIRKELTDRGMYIGKNLNSYLDIRCIQKLSMSQLEKIIPKNHLSSYINCFNNNYLEEYIIYTSSTHFIINPEYILQSIEKIHYTIKSYFYQTIVHITTIIESELMLKTLTHMKNLNILPISIHDCIVVPKKYKQYFFSFLYKTFYTLIFNIKNNNKIFSYINNVNKYINFSNFPPSIFFNINKKNKNNQWGYKNNLINSFYIIMNEFNLDYINSS